MLVFLALHHDDIIENYAIHRDMHTQRMAMAGLREDAHKRKKFCQNVRVCSMEKCLLVVAAAGQWRVVNNIVRCNIPQ